MRISINIMGHLLCDVEGLQREYRDLEVPDGITPAEALSRIGLKRELLYMVLVNGSRINGDYHLKDGDRVTVFSPPAGG